MGDPWSLVKDTIRGRSSGAASARQGDVSFFLALVGWRRRKKIQEGL